MRHILLILGFVLILPSLSAQSFRGTVLQDNDGGPIQGARVLLLQTSDSSRYGAFTRSDGSFLIFPEQGGVFQLTISAEGFSTHRQLIELPDGDAEMPEPVRLIANYELEEVSIEAERAPAQQKGDTTEYNASAFTTNPDASASDLIAKMPGITTTNGQTQAQGETVQQVLVDGRPFFGNDPQAALNNLPAEVVDKIQVFDQQSEQSQFTGFDDGNTTKTINIVTKPETRNGTFGTGYAGYGTDERYRAGGNINFFNDAQRLSVVGMTNNINQQNFAADDLLGVASGGGRGRRGGGFGGRGGGGGGNVSDFLVGESGGISTTHAFGINYSDEFGERLKITGSYFFNLSDNVLEQTLLQQVVTGRDTGQIYQEALSSESRNINHRANLRLELDLTENTSLIFRPRMTIQQNSGSELSLGSTTLGDALLNQSNVDFGSDLQAVDASGLLLLRHRFEKPGRTLSIRLQGGYNQSAGSNSQYSELTYFSSRIPSDTLDQQSFLDADGWDAGANVMFTERVSDKGMWSTWYEYSPRWNDSDQETYAFSLQTDAYSDLDTLLSNTFETVYRTHEVGTGLMWRFDKAFLMTRVGLQDARLENDQVFPRVDSVNLRFLNVLPMVMLRLGERRGSKNFFAMYRSNTDAPSVSQLQSVIDNSNPLRLSSGNPALEQAVQHRLILRYNRTNTEKGRVLSLNGSAQLSQDYIASGTWIAASDTLLGESVFLPLGGQFTQPVNLDGYVNARTFVTFGQLVEPLKTNVNLSLSSNYRRTPGLINGVENLSQTISGGLGVVLSSNISENIDFTLSSHTDLNQTTNSLQEQLNTQYWSQRSTAKVNLIARGGWVLRGSLNHQLYRGLTDEFNQDYFLLSGGVAKKLFQNQRGEIELSMFDILGQNTSISRTATELYIQDLQQTVLQQYLMLSFRYQLRNFEPEVPGDRSFGPPPGMGPDGPRPGGRP